MVLTKLCLGFLKVWNFNELFLFSLTWDPMGAKISKRYSSYKLQPKAFIPKKSPFLNFLPNGPHKTTVGSFEILKIEILMIFFSFSLTWDPKFQNATPPSNQFWILSNFFLNFLLSGPHKSTVLDWWNLEFPIFNEFFKFTIVPYGETKNLNYLENEWP